MTSTQSSKPKKHYTFTCYQANLTVPPHIILKFTPSNATFSQDLSSRPNLNKKQPSQPSQPKKPPPTGLARILNEIWKKVSQKDTQKIFAYPVTEDIAPGYFNVVKHPMDLSTIRTKIHDDEYQTLQQFSDDMKLMFTNCLTYNPKITIFYQQGEQLFQFFRRQLKTAKKQLLGNNQQFTSSALVRSTREGEQFRREAITSLPIPVVYETPQHLVYPFPDLHKKDETKESLRETFYYVPQPNTQTDEQSDCSQEKFETFCDVLRVSKPLRHFLAILRENFPNYILDKAVRSISNVDTTFQFPKNAIDSIVSNENQENDTTDDQPLDINLEDFLPLGVGETPIPSSYIESSNVPKLPLDSIRPHLEETCSIREQNLRLMLFYINTMQFWTGHDLLKGKETIIKKIKENITKLIMEISPSQLLKTPDCNVLQHIMYSIPAS